MTVGEKIRKLRKENHITQEALAKSINAAKQTIFKYETGVITNIPMDKLEKIALILNTSPAYLMGWVDNPESSPTISHETTTPPASVEYKEVDSLQIGKDSKVANVVYTGKKVSIQKSDLNGRREEDCFVLRVKNDMNSPRLLPDDELLCCRCDKVESGEIAVVYYHGEEASIKQVYYNNDGTIELVPANPAYRSQFIDGERLKTFHILGEIIMLIRKKF